MKTHEHCTFEGTRDGQSLQNVRSVTLMLAFGFGVGSVACGKNARVTNAEDTMDHGSSTGAVDTTDTSNGLESGDESESDGGSSGESSGGPVEAPCEPDDVSCWLDYCGQVSFPGSSVEDCRALRVCDHMHVQELEDDECLPRQELCWPLDVSWGWSEEFDNGSGAPSAIWVESAFLYGVFLFPGIDPIPGPLGAVSHCSSDFPCEQCLTCDERELYLGQLSEDCR
jgi:hypothetical protein